MALPPTVLVEAKVILAAEVEAPLLLVVAVPLTLVVAVPLTLVAAVPLTLVAAQSMRLRLQYRNSPQVADTSRPSITLLPRSVVQALADSPESLALDQPQFVPQRA